MDKQRFLRLARLFANELRRYGLRPRTLLESKVNEEDEALWIRAARWITTAPPTGKRPEIGIFAGEHGTEGPYVWFGFWSEKDEIKKFMQDQIAHGVSHITITQNDLNGNEYDQSQLEELKREARVAYEPGPWEDDKFDYFGKYYLEADFGSGYHDEKPIVNAAQFVGEIVQSIDPRLSEDWDLADLKKLKKDDATTYEALVQARRGQGEFRARLEAKWDYRCAILGCKARAVLRASHIKPWAASSGPNQNQERLDGNNGLLLTATLDALFDKGLITFEETGDIKLSTSLGPDDRSILKLDELKLAKALNDEQKRYLAYHREHVFRK